MVQLLLYSSIITLLSITVYRYSFPYPISEYISLFILLFTLGFASNVMNRSWGRIWIVVGSLSLVRLGSWGGVLTTIPEWTTLHPLLLGGIWGILVKEFILLKSRPGKERILVGNVHLVFIFFLLILGIERFIEYNPGYNPLTGSIFPSETFYYPGLSGRQAFQLSWMILDSIIPALFYFSLDDTFKRDGENPANNYRFGLWVVFILQGIVIIVQTFFQPSAFMQDTGLSLPSGRVAGLFKDSGSASWIYPTIGIFLFLSIRNRKGLIVERIRIALLILVYCMILIGGIKMGRTFWLVFATFSFYLAMNGFLKMLPLFNSIFRNLVAFLAVIFVGAIFYSLLWFGEYQNRIPALNRSSKEWKMVLESGSLERVDGDRIRLILTSWNLFQGSPIFGNGLGSLIVELKRPDSKLLHKPKKGFVDSPSNFFVGWLGDVGILGSVVLACYLGLNGYIRKSFGMYLLLVLPLMTGFQLVHSDGGFFIAFILLGSVNYERIRWKIQGEKLRIVWFIIGIGIALHYLVFSLLRNS